VDGALECYERGLLVIGEHTFVGRSRIYAANEVRIGANVLISDNVAIMDSDLHPRNRRLRREQTRNVARGAFPDVYSDVEGAPVLIGDDVWIGYGATILKGVQIGEGAIIGARSLVIRDVRANSVVAGSPAAEIGSADVGN
jgi:acetyltransferase-like isoleucine patch superfamily enzyme